jgi:hypothetical protein
MSGVGGDVSEYAAESVEKILKKVLAIPAAL